MPYIKCPDGNTYSKYDRSEYVQWCICNEKENKAKELKACMEDPKCKEQYLEKQRTADIAILVMSSILVTLIIAVTLTIKTYKKIDKI